MQTNPKLLSYNWTTTDWGRDLGKYLIQLFICFSTRRQSVSWLHSYISCFWFRDTETVYVILQTNGKTAVLSKEAQKRCLLTAARARTKHRPSHQRPEDQKRRRRKIPSSRYRTSAHMYAPDKCQSKSSIIQVWRRTQLSLAIGCWQFIFPCQALINSIL